jgi:hypothetical protein
MALKRYNFVLRMSNREVIKLMLAVALLFATHGPAFLLANSVLAPGSWALLGVRTFLTGSFSACIILAIRKPWLGVPVAILGLLAMISAEKITTVITGKDERVIDSISETIHVSPSAFASIREQRLAFYGVTAFLVGCSWAMMAVVLNSEGKKRGRLEAELAIARDIQRSLLPVSTFNNPWCSVTGLAIPTSEVGGDYFDVVKLSDDLVAVIIADVSGHGVGAGIVSAMTKSALHSQLVHDPSPSGVLSNLNRTLFSLTASKTFVTCAYILLNHRTRTAAVATAGHPPVLHRTSKDLKILELRMPNLALGLKDDVPFKEKRIRYQPGDVFCLYTDGIVEALNKQDEQFGPERLRKALAAGIEAPDLCTHIIGAARTFCGSKDFQDDATIVTVSFNDRQMQPGNTSARVSHGS